MALVTDAAGKRFGPYEAEYTGRDTQLYALAVGADERVSLYFLERFGPVVVPTFAAVPAFQAAVAILPELGVAGSPIVHGEHRLALRNAIPPSGHLSTEISVRGIYDKGSGALLDLVARTTVDGKALSDNEIAFFVLGAGGFGGERGPKTEKFPAPARAPDHEVRMATAGTQAIFYQHCFPPHPALESVPLPPEGNLHIDPEAARAAGFDAPLLQGLCTFGYLARAVILSALKEDAGALVRIRARFAAPVHPGQALQTGVWREDGRWLACMKNEAGEVIISDAVIETG